VSGPERLGIAQNGLSNAAVSRRRFLQAVPLTAVALAACRQRPYRQADFVVPDRSPMALLPAETYGSDLTDLILRGLTMLGQDVRGRRVFLKPNMVEYWSDKAVNTDPRVVAAAAEAMLKAGAREVVVGEGPGHRRDVEYLLEGTGLQDVLTDMRLRFVDLNHDDVRRVPLKSRFTELEAIWLPVELLQSDYIVSMPKLKTHHLAGMTASMKNLFGTVPGAVYGWPKNLLHFHGIDQSIIDLTATVRPQLTIVDGILAMEGDGPIMGRPRPLGFIGMGTDLVAVDATCARVIGLDPDKMPYLSVAGEFLGNVDSRRIVQRGESPDRYRAQFDVIEPIRRLRA
jgi:uncharacterized protein (DUF362 family)